MIDGDATRTQRIFGQIEREAVGIVELERDAAIKHVALPHRLGRFVEQMQPLLERPPEAQLLAFENLLDQRLRANETGIGLPHLPGERGHEAVEQRLARADEVRVAHRAPHDPPKHVAAPFVRRQHPVGDEKGGRAQMIGDDAMAAAHPARGAHPGRRLRRGDQRAKQVDLVIVVHALQHRGDPLQPHAGIDARPGQRPTLAIGLLVELHEDEVPDLDEAVAVFVGRAGRAAGDVVAVIVEHFGARAAWAGFAHRPEIVGGGDAQDAAFGKPGDLAPQIERLVVGMVDGRGQPPGVETPFAGQQRPGVLDRVCFEIVAEAEIAEHLEKGVMARGVADIVQIVVLAPRANAFLARRRARGGRALAAGEGVLERHHARVDEHQRGIVVRDQRRAGHHRVIGGGEMVQKGLPDLVGGMHRAGPKPSTRRRQARASGAGRDDPGRRAQRDERPVAMIFEALAQPLLEPGALGVGKVGADRRARTDR